MSQYSSQVNNIEEGFQILVRATEIASEFLKLAQEDRRLKLNFLLSAEASCTQAHSKKTTCPLSTFDSAEITAGNGFYGRADSVPVQELENSVFECCTRVYNSNQPDIQTKKDYSMHHYCEPVNTNSFKQVKVERNRLLPLQTTTTTYCASGMNSSGCNSSLEYRTGKKAVHCFSELSSANSFMSLDGSSRQTISRRGRRRNNPSLSEEQRRKLRTLKNREAAEKARIRKRERERLLEEHLNRVLNENRRLEKELLWLKEVRASSCL
ncbi:hypothetical protein Gasu2_07030 [Galdieria sulphuraria]|uniref:BZIP domain-containing protein n=1 Tax=Galdieria sulphuraria TaxID=130081 RepID=M2X129_GALSU|nr:uncharacterized protein Gasu_26530 [Galdieria sulphuraria]EME30070.1 hypothetical protein Gasu_26530 [Galdieria sulphuraria]GJD06277.1 hypothetical protein Gasu2_07030 [Galdieria sulphuraria]|eukprot:XP_005706590.1 hypothetical protein Gasu_26530 [Galdieria sulphuraria]